MGLTLPALLTATMTCPILPSAPEIDGTISETEYEGAALLGSFTVYQPSHGDSPAGDTQVRVGRSETHLYVAVQAADPAI